MIGIQVCCMSTLCIAVHDATVVEMLCECHDARGKVHIDEYSDCVVHYEQILIVISSRIYSVDSVQCSRYSAGAEPLRVITIKTGMSLGENYNFHTARTGSMSPVEWRYFQNFPPCPTSSFTPP